MQIYIISVQIDIWYKLSKQGEILSLMVRWKQTHWNTLAHRMTVNATVFSQCLIIIHLLLCVFFYKYMTNNLHLFYIDSAESKNCAFEIRTENGVLPEKRFVGLHTLMCHAEREKTLSRASVMPCGCGTCSATLENIKFDFFSMCECFSIFIGQKSVLSSTSYCITFCIVIHLPTLRLALC